MPELAEPIIQTDAFEPTLYDVMDQLAAVHDRIDSTDDRIDTLRENMDERFTLVDQKFIALSQQVGDVQTTLTEVVKHLKVKGVRLRNVGSFQDVTEL